VETTSLKEMAKEKKSLTQDVRKAGISEMDEAFMDNFSETMTQKSNSTESLSEAESTSGANSTNATSKSDKIEEYQVSEKELHDTLNKAK